jgi:hypothetical protein
MAREDELAAYTGLVSNPWIATKRLCYNNNKHAYAGVNDISQAAWYVSTVRKVFVFGDEADDGSKRRRRRRETARPKGKEWNCCGDVEMCFRGSQRVGDVG